MTVSDSFRFKGMVTSPIGFPLAAAETVLIIGTAEALAFSKNSPTGAAILEQTCLGSSQRAFISSTKTAVVLPSRTSGFASGRLGPSCAPAAEPNSTAKVKTSADLRIMDCSPKCLVVLLLAHRSETVDESFSQPAE